MGTNYYWYNKGKCPTCGRSQEPLHIGKSSCGWCFTLHVIPDECITNLSDWKIRFDIPSSYIEDEYGDRISKEEMISIIKLRFWEKKEHSKRFYEDNDSEPGPNNLLRHKIDGRFCIGHGEGTWDYVVGEFS